jgi:hypothetical protein
MSLNPPFAAMRGFRFLGWCAGAVLLALVPAGGYAQGTLTTILTNGPTANRINLVVLSEGYQASELGKFLSDATNMVNSILAAPPYQEYRSYFNAFAIAVASPQSGSDHYTPTTSLVNTYFNSTYDSYGIQYLITIPPNDRDSDYSHGRGKVDALLQALMPEYDYAVLVVNDTQYGGSGGPVLVTSVNSSSSEIVVHESGHTLGGLTDEYSSAYPGYVPVEMPNATTQTNRALIKWTSWISGTTPVPTPANAPYLGVVGLFQGAEYQTSGWYRPKYDCKMNHLGIAFCEVCSEQLVKTICQTVRLIDAYVPAATNLSLAGTQAVQFGVTPLQPRTHNLSVQWFTNGVPAFGGTNTSFTLFPRFFGNGTNTVQAQVRDPTGLVLSDPTGLLTNSVSWNLNIAISDLRLVAAQWLASGGFAFSITGAAPQGFVIQASTNLSAWIPLSTNSLVSGQFRYTNYGAGALPSRFYRASAPP